MKKALKIIIPVLCLLIIIGAVAVYRLRIVRPEVFTAEEMSITLTNEFWESPVDGFTACFASEDVSVYALKENYTGEDTLGDITLEEYGQTILETNALTDTAELLTKENLTYFEYAYETEEGDSYGYCAFIYKTSDSFWLIQFSAAEDDLDEYYDTFFEWAGTVTFEP